MGRCEACDDGCSNEIPAKCVACVGRLEARLEGLEEALESRSTFAARHRNRADSLERKIRDMTRDRDIALDARAHSKREEGFHKAHAAGEKRLADEAREALAAVEEESETHAALNAMKKERDHLKIIVEDKGLCETANAMAKLADERDSLKTDLIAANLDVLNGKVHIAEAEGRLRTIKRSLSRRVECPTEPCLDYDLIQAVIKVCDDLKRVRKELEVVKGDLKLLSVPEPLDAVQARKAMMSALDELKLDGNPFPRKLVWSIATHYRKWKALV